MTGAHQIPSRYCGDTRKDNTDDVLHGYLGMMAEEGGKERGWKGRGREGCLAEVLMFKWGGEEGEAKS